MALARNFMKVTCIWISVGVAATMQLSRASRLSAHKIGLKLNSVAERLVRLVRFQPNLTLNEN